MNNIEFYDQHQTKALSEEILNEIKSSLETLGIINSTVEIDFVTPLEITKLNFKHRQKNKPTDVLSFPQSDIPGCIRPHLGSIVIAPVVVEEKGESITDVIKHGILHLQGFDHEKNETEWNKFANKINCGL